MNQRICIEACIASVEDAIAAYEGGADRLELNTALSLDGLTPSIGVLRRVKEAVPLPVIVMIRPRPFGFAYSASEFEVMQQDVDAFLQEGVAGFAFGVLHADHQIDHQRVRLLVRQMEGVDKVFHRAFDITPSAKKALEVLTDLGINRVLTSGHQPTAMEGADKIKDLIVQAGGHIEILPGSGINPSNVAAILSQTGCNQIHGTFRAPYSRSTVSGMDALRISPPPGTSKAVVAKTRGIVDSL